VGWESSTQLLARMQQVDGKSVLRMEYRQGKGSKRPFGLTDHIDARYAQMKSLKLVLRSVKPAALTAQFREDDGTYEGPDYGATFKVEGGKEWQTVRVPLKDFKALPGKADAGRQLAMDKAWLFVLHEGIEGDAPADNTLEIDSIAAVLED